MKMKRMKPKDFKQNKCVKFTAYFYYFYGACHLPSLTDCWLKKYECQLDVKKLPEINSLIKIRT
jgi:hypothetical protein